MYKVDRVNGNGTVDLIDFTNYNTLIRNVKCELSVKKGDLVITDPSVTLVVGQQ